MDMHGIGSIYMYIVARRSYLAFEFCVIVSEKLGGQSLTQTLGSVGYQKKSAVSSTSIVRCLQ